MNSTELQLVFEGEALRGGKINAEVLGTTLAAFSDVFTRANELANGDASEARVFVESKFAAGSFDVNVQLVQDIIETARGLITAHPFLSASELAVAIGIVWSKKESLIKILKWLKGGKPEKITQSRNNVDLVFLGQKKTVSNTINIFMNDSLLRQALSRVVGPVLEPGIERISIKPRDAEGDGEPILIEKGDAPAFDPASLQLEAGEAEREGERDAVLIVSKLSFREGPKWTFFERGSMLVASIKDAEFWQSVHHRKYKFAEGDQLRVRLHWKMVDRDGKSKPENSILRVYEVLQRARQLRLDQPDEEGV